MRRYLIAAAIAVPSILFLFVAAGYAHDEVISSDRVARNVDAGGVDLSRLDRDHAVQAIQVYEHTLATSPVDLMVDGRLVELDPMSIGFDIDEEAVVDAAMAAHRPGGFISNFASWFGSWTSTERIDIPISYDEGALSELLTTMSRTTINKPAYEGAVVVRNGVAEPEYPQPGLLIDEAGAIPLIAAQLARPNRSTIELPLAALAPKVTDRDVDVAVVKANTMIADSVVLRGEAPGSTLLFTPSALAAALRSDVVEHSPATVEVHLDPELLTEIAARSVDSFTIPPVDASFAWDEETKDISIIPSKRGLKVDLSAIPEAVTNAALSNHRGALPMVAGDEAALTTEMAEAMKPFGEVSTFTTYHPCCQSRVTNIQRLADQVRGAIVLPGEVFSINDRVGQRTFAKGYVKAGAIIDGRVQCCDSVINIGGGTSQFATTLYNAVFFGCYEDVFHQPHSLYFSRYPFVREATLGYPAPDVKFRNDSPSVLVIDTSYTSTSITVTIYGNSGGRTCEARRDGNTVTRVMTHADGSVTTQEWTWHYRDPSKPTTTTTVVTTTTTTAGTSTTTTTVVTTSTTTTTTSTTTTSSTTTSSSTTTPAGP